jgi:molybdopterin-guanine dinucleotide biosynthesis protein A
MWVGELDSGARSSVGGYVLAGGRSSRMGRDKALLELAGKPLIEHALRKMQRVCVDVRILGGANGGDPAHAQALAAYAPVVFDLHPGCGPIGGIEAALADSAHEWRIVLPVDLPFVPAAFLEAWMARVVAQAMRCRIAIFSTQGRAHPALCLLHKQVAPYIAEAVERGEFKLMPAFQTAAKSLAAKGEATPDEVLRVDAVGDEPGRVWWMNLNTPADFAEAEKWSAELDGLPK